MLQQIWTSPSRVNLVCVDSYDEGVLKGNGGVCRGDLHQEIPRSRLGRSVFDHRNLLWGGVGNTHGQYMCVILVRCGRNLYFFEKRQNSS